MSEDKEVQDTDLAATKEDEANNGTSNEESS